MEAEVFHDIGIAPALEQFALPWGQPFRISSRAVLRRERRAEAIEPADAIGGQLVKLSRGTRRHHGNEAADRLDDRPDDRNGSRLACKSFAGGKKFGLRGAGCEGQRRLQCRVESVFARVFREVAPIRRELRDTAGKRQVGAVESVIAEQVRAEAIKFATGRRAIIDRVARTVWHEFPESGARLKPSHAAATALRGKATAGSTRSASVIWTRRPAAITATMRGLR